MEIFLIEGDPSFFKENRQAEMMRNAGSRFKGRIVLPYGEQIRE